MPADASRIPLPRVLIIDDDAISRDVLAMMLEMHGFPVDSAESGNQALAMLENWADNDLDALPGLILMDTQMPGISGVQLVRFLRQFSTAPLIAISGSDPGEAIRSVTDGFLLKPIQAEDIVSLVQNGFQRKKASVVPSTASQTGGISSEVIVDPEVLRKLKAMMPASAVREIYAAVAADLHARIATLQAAMSTQNLTEVQRIAHAIKGGCAMAGVTIASEAASRLEISNLQVTWPGELAKLHHALGALEGMLGGDFPA